CDVDAVTEEVGAVGDDFADMKADSEPEPLVGLRLKRNCAVERGDNAWKFGEETIASRIHHSAADCLDALAEPAHPVRQGTAGSTLVSRHQLREAGNVCMKQSSEMVMRSGRCHHIRERHLEVEPPPGMRIATPASEYHD